jgi:hypothetical protein
MKYSPKIAVPKRTEGRYALRRVTVPARGVSGIWAVLSQSAKVLVEIGRARHIGCAKVRQVGIRGMLPRDNIAGGAKK